MFDFFVGTSDITGPAFAVSALNDHLDLSSDCNNFDSLPQVTFVFEDAHGARQGFEIGADEYILREKNYKLENIFFYRQKFSKLSELVDFQIPKSVLSLH